MHICFRLHGTQITTLLVHPGIVPTSLSRYYGPLSLLYAGLAAGWTKTVQQVLTHERSSVDPCHDWAQTLVAKLSVSNVHCPCSRQFEASCSLVTFATASLVIVMQQLTIHQITRQ